MKKLFAIAITLTIIAAAADGAHARSQSSYNLKRFLGGSVGQVYRLGQINQRAYSELGWEIGRYTVLQDPYLGPQFDPGRYSGPHWYQQ